ncbi:uncharacterized protein [Hoplias malabaricus]|uniref:uncharacterized protein isoform X2 n=1 Tax=Hoplias malabaricus TaxID=27720 RepID=UPI0034633611
MTGTELLWLVKENYKTNVFLLLILTGLVVCEKFAEADFVCPCERDYMRLFFSLYLIVPAFIAFTITFYIAFSLIKTTLSGGRKESGEHKESDEAKKSGEAQVSGGRKESGEHKESDEAKKSGEAQVSGGRKESGEHKESDEAKKSGEAPVSDVDQESGGAPVSGEPKESGEVQVSDVSQASSSAQVSQGGALVPGGAQGSDEAQKADRRRKCFIFLYSLIPLSFWILLFFCDGRYVACLTTKLNPENVDSNLHPPWEWCSINRTLTDDQRRAQMSFYNSKVAGFVLLLVISLVALIYKCCGKCCGTCSKPCCGVRWNSVCDQCLKCCFPPCCTQCCVEDNTPSSTTVVVEITNFKMEVEKLDPGASKLSQTLLDMGKLTFQLQLKQSEQPNPNKKTEPGKQPQSEQSNKDGEMETESTSQMGDSGQSNKDGETKTKVAPPRRDVNMELQGIETIVSSFM